MTAVRLDRRPELRLVLYFCLSGTVGGGEIFALRTAKALRELGVPCVVVLPARSAILPLALELEVPFQVIRCAPKLGRKTVGINVAWAPWTYIRMRRLLRRTGTRCIMQYKREQLLLPRRHRRSATHIEHGPVPRAIRQSMVLRRRLKRAYQGAIATFAVSDPARQSLSDLGVAEPRPLPAGTDRAAIARIVSCSPSGAEQPRTLVYCGRLARDKGLELFVAVLDQLGPSWHGLVIGDGEMAQAVADELAARSLTDRCTMLGFRSDPLAALASAGVLLVPGTSPGEGRPLVALDALGLGLGVVGLKESPAMRALAAEFGQIELAVADVQPVCEAVERVQRRPRVAVPLRGWEDVATDLMRGWSAEMDDVGR